jgi:hypothetical protein
MTKTLSDMFAAAKAPRIDWAGESVYAIYEIDPVPDGMIVEFLRAKDAPVQGLSLTAKGGMLMINNIEASDIALWHDTAPAKVSVRVKRKPRAKMTLKFWNIWRQGTGETSIIQAWQGDAGMRIDKVGGGKELLLRCSDGEGPVDFNDLKVRLIVE